MENIKSYFIAEWNLSQFSNEFMVDFKKNVILTMKSYDKDHVLVKTNKLIIDNGLKGKYDKNDLEKWYKFIKNNTCINKNYQFYCKLDSEDEYIGFFEKFVPSKL